MKRRKTTKYFTVIITVFLFLFIFLPITISSFAQSGEVKGDVIVNALVPSKVDDNQSEVNASTDKALADNVQRIVVTIKLKDADGNPLPNIKVKLTSNRGAVDRIRAISAGNISSLFIPSAYAADAENVATTDAEGAAYFEVLSSVPGDLILTPVADTLVTLESLNLTFLPLPFPKNVTISVEVPKFISPTGEVTLLKPSGENAPGETAEKSKIVNLGVNVKIPLWIILLVLLSGLMNVGLFALVISMMFKVRKTEKQEEFILEKEEEVLDKISKKDV